MIARAPVPSASPMQWEAVGRTVVAVLTIRASRAVGAIVALGLRRLRLLLLRLAAAGDERWQPLDILLVRWDLLLGARLKGLRLGLRVLLARIERLLLARCERLAADWLFIAIVVAVIAEVAALISALLITVRLALTKLLLRGSDQAKVMFGVLIIIFRRDRVARALRVPGQLEILFGDVGRGAANFNVRPIGLVHTRQWILMMMATFAVATPHALVLTVSHGLLFRQPPYVPTARMPPLKLTECHCNSTHYDRKPHRSIDGAKRQSSALTAARHVNLLKPQQYSPYRRFRRGVANPSWCATFQKCAPTRWNFSV
jgi:hypothetical protein